MGINIVFAHTNKIDIEKQSNSEVMEKQSNSEVMEKQSNSEVMEKQINECQNLATNFWKCLHKHSHLKEVAVNCGPEYFNMMKCIDKIK